MAIRVLDNHLINQIAAGEVVERPAHLVKELVENSIDAGATEIHIEWTDGGRYAKVSDNGSGIAKEDLSLAFQRHATSKISSSEDLWALDSFGFRGEALASMGAVSRMSIRSGSFKVTADFGRLSEVISAAPIKGTEVTVEQLFENIPARLKFLKSPTAENMQIKSILKAMALCNEGVTFHIKQDDKLLYFWPSVATFKERVAQVLELDPSDFYVAKGTEQGFTCEVALLPPNRVAHNLKQVLTFVRNRSVQDRTLQQAVVEAYRGTLMHGEYPIAIVKLDCSPAEVDVNVHPTKSIVKFRNNQLPFRVIYKTARDFIQTAPWVEAISRPSTPAPALPENFSLDLDAGISVTPSTQSFFETKTVDYQPQRFEPMSEERWSRLKILGQSHLTYLICESEKGLLLIDQHAAHERVLFERLQKIWETGTADVQRLLLPLTVDLTEDQVACLQDQFETLKKLGIEVETVGPQAVAVTAYPAILEDGAVATILPKIADEVLQWGSSFRFEKLLGDIFATMACHSAVRAGQSLTLEQMRELLEQMDEFRESSFCPHGRPVFVELPKTEMERRFGRIN